MAAILIVDDDFVMRRVLGVTLRRDGHDTTAVESADEALAELQLHPYDLLITDLDLPGMDGLTLLRTIRSHDRLKEIPVIMLTASAQERDDARARAEGVNAFLTKPTGSREIIDVVNSVLA